MTRRKGQTKTYLIRIDENCKSKLDKLRHSVYVKLSYNDIINEILSNQKQIELYKQCCKLMLSIDTSNMSFTWELDKLIKYVSDQEIKRK